MDLTANANRGTVTLKDFEVVACHGVNPEEKKNPQRFLISVEIFEDIFKAASGDDLEDTVSYSAVKKIVKSFVEGNCFDLIETLAVRLARLILDEFPLAEAISVEVKKPDAPMSGKFDYVSAKAELARRKIYLSLGANLGDEGEYFDFAIAKFKENPAFTNLRESARIVTEPYGGVADRKFLNSVVEADCYMPLRELLDFVHKVENMCGRTREVRWGNRTLDIDILFYGDVVCGDGDLAVPHADMCNRSFVLEPLCELAPNFVHPLTHKRVRDMLAELRERERA